MKKICILLVLALLPWLAQSQKLGEIKDALKSGNSGGRSNSEGRNFGGNNDDFWLEFFFQLAWEPTWWLFYGAPGEVRANEIDFNDYPYADGENGLYLPYEFTSGKQMSLQLTGHLQTDEDAVYGGFFQAKWSPNRAISLDVNRLQLLETLDDTDGGGIDHFSITNFNFAYNRVRHSKFQLWWGGGLMLLNGGGNEVLYGSPSFNGGFTWYFKKPLSLYADTQLGYPNSVFARQNQLRLQIHLKQFMVYAGFQGTKVGDVRLPSVAVGSGVWF
ncbi:MAG: hypothetical protein K9J37_02350 [Saprospiraceae bacterium]|nr:hypothetical protein [Saprospiraceae bacterium]MCF8248721.1 hypothetical protein [Saprospiraceae bacterium]MCF8278789.1 hypothetical protein [Bacteroidales bacterium]MCF8310589.1 hypothetical protein [Saprospiraceae bacterium]MCF8439148.1 hypothetical protein [Saprospiraceae bacterium]